MQTRAHPRALEHAVAILAARQGGVVAHHQLRALGIGAGAIKHRVAVGRLRPVPGHRAVFAVGHSAATPRTGLWAAYLAVGESAVISHRSAAALLDLRPFSGRVELTVPGASRRRSAIRVHRTTWLPDEDVTRIDRLPVTTVERTLLDLGAVAPLRAVERAYDRAVMARVVDHRAIQRVLQEGPARPGAAKLRAVLARDAAGSTLTDNELEELMLAIVRRAGLPAPVCQYSVLGYRADFCWPAARLIVETDGDRAHGTPRAIAHDARRDVRLQLAGWRVMRFPRIELLRDPRWVAEAIRAGLRRG